MFYPHQKQFRYVIISINIIVQIILLYHVHTYLINTQNITDIISNSLDPLNNPGWVELQMV